MTVTTEPEPWTGRAGVDLTDECGARALRLELQVEVTRIRVFCDRRELDVMVRAAFKEWPYHGRRPSKAGGLVWEFVEHSRFVVTFDRFRYVLPDEFTHDLMRTI